jgi:hypothetical protein
VLALVFEKKEKKKKIMLYYYLTGNALQRTQGWAKTCFGRLLLQVFHCGTLQ